MKHIKTLQESFVEELNEIKFTKTPMGMLPVGKKGAEFNPNIKIKKSDWDGIFAKIENLPAAKRVDLVKKLHALGLL